MLNIDGSYKYRDHGIGGIGGVFRNVHSEWILGFSMKTRLFSALHVEIVALWYGIHLAWQHKLLRLEIKMDFDEAIKLMEYNKNAKYEHLIFDCREALDTMQYWQLRHTFREGNKVIDAPTAQGGDLTVVQLEVYTRPPSPAIGKLMDEDVDGKGRRRNIKSPRDEFHPS